MYVQKMKSMEQRSARMEYLHWNQILVALLVTILFSLWSKLEAEKANLGGTSWPVHHLTTWSPNNKDRKKKYDEFMQGCREMYEDVCDSNERDRTEMNLRQPQSVVNYTKTGFVKVPAPKELKDILTEFWELNKDKKAKENVRSTINGGISTRTNHWKSETYMVSVEDTSLEGAGYGLKVKLWMAARDVVEEWTGMKLQPASIYGIRVYTDGAILAPHVDRLPLVSSCIVNIAQDVDEPWPLEVIDRQGKAVNITMEPGDMILYESHSLVHGRPFPLKGRYFANIFIHFEPTERNHHSSDDAIETDIDIPPYILKNSREEANWRSQNPHGWRAHNAHEAAHHGNIEMLAKIAARNTSLLQAKDINGWQPIHEASRSGHTQTAKFLVDHGADMNARTYGGSSPLNLARMSLGERHDIVEYLASLGALDIGLE